MSDTIKKAVPIRLLKLKERGDMKAAKELEEKYGIPIDSNATVAEKPLDNFERSEKKKLEDQHKQSQGNAYRLARQFEYPSVGDQLDELWKGLDALQKRRPVPKGTADMLKKIQDVKARHPKPEEKQDETA